MFWEIMEKVRRIRKKIIEWVGRKGKDWQSWMKIGSRLKKWRKEYGKKKLGSEIVGQWKEESKEKVE